MELFNEARYGSSWALGSRDGWKALQVTVTGFGDLVILK